MSYEKDNNVIRVDFRQRQVLPADEEPVALPDADAEESKFATFSRLVEEGLVMVTLDTRVPGVSVPAAFANQPQLHLNFSHRFRIQDFAYDEASVRATLSFDSGEFFCVVPWAAVYVMVCEVADACHLYPSEFPAELQSVLPKLLAQLEGAEADATGAKGELAPVEDDDA